MHGDLRRHRLLAILMEGCFSGILLLHFFFFVGVMFTFLNLVVRIDYQTVSTMVACIIS